MIVECHEINPPRDLQRRAVCRKGHAEEKSVIARNFLKRRAFCATFSARRSASRRRRHGLIRHRRRLVVTAGVHVLNPGQKVKFYVDPGASQAPTAPANGTAVSVK